MWWLGGSGGDSVADEECVGGTPAPAVAAEVVRRKNNLGNCAARWQCRPWRSRPRCGGGEAVVPQPGATGRDEVSPTSSIAFCICLITPVRKAITGAVSVVKRPHAVTAADRFDPCLHVANFTGDERHSCPSSACFGQRRSELKAGLLKTFAVAYWDEHHSCPSRARLGSGTLGVEGWAAEDLRSGLLGRTPQLLIEGLHRARKVQCRRLGR